MTTADDSGVERLLSLEVERRDDACVVRLGGELDVASAGAFRARMDQLLIEGVPMLVVDLTGLAFTDSSGLGALVRTHKRARVLQVPFVIVGGGGQPQDLFRTTGLSRVFRVFDSLDDAVASAG
jgi:anti-sigma B factor antagonist